MRALMLRILVGKPPNAKLPTQTQKAICRAVRRLNQVISKKRFQNSKRLFLTNKYNLCTIKEETYIRNKYFYSQVYSKGCPHKMELLEIQADQFLKCMRSVGKLFSIQKMEDKKC